MLLASVTMAATHLTVSASAQQTFASRAQVIKAGVVILESSRNGPLAQPVSAAPYAWFNLDSNKTVKPAGWTFVNPHGKSVMDAAEKARWVAIETSLDPHPNIYKSQGIPTRYSKRNAAYWEARIGQMSDSQIADYDVLLVSPVYNARLSPSEREKLRRFVDKGGVLWIDPSALAINSIDLANSFPSPFGLAGATNVPEFRDATQPLINGPQPLSLRDLTVLSGVPDGNFYKDLVAPPVPATGLLFGESFADFYRIKPVVGVSQNQFSMGVSRIGDGFVVVTSRAVAMKLNRVRVAEDPQNFSYRSNLSFAGRDANLQTDGLAAAKFAVNMISLAREYGQPQGGSQKNGSSPVDVGAPLIARAYDESIAGINTPPVLYKGLLVATAGDVVRVYDADPARDFDGDGNTDDGIPDPGVDGRDLIWQSAPLGQTLSAPVCVEVPNTSILSPEGRPASDQVLVTDSAGDLHAFDLMRFNANGTVFIDAAPGRLDMNNSRGYSGAAYPLTAPGQSGNYHLQAPELVHPPTVHENMAYMADRINTNSAGRVWMVDLVSGVKPVGRNGLEWFIGGNAGSSVPLLSASSTIGFIPILDNSGGVDRVLYAPISNIPGTSPGQAAGFTSIWLGAKGEKPAEYEPQGVDVASGLTVTTRAGREGLPIYQPTTPSPYGIRLTLLRADGTVYSGAEMAAVFSGDIAQPTPGTLVFDFVGGATSALPADVAGIRVDYSIDFGGGGADLANAKRGDVQLPDSSANERYIVGNLALTPRGTLYMTTTNNSRSALYGFREEGRGTFRCVMRYELFIEHTMGGQGISDTTVPALFEDVDPVQEFAPAFLRQPFTRFQFRSAPVVRGDVVYAVAAGWKGIVPAAVVMAFKAEPETASIYIRDFPANGSIVQPDLGRSVTRRPEIAPAFQVGQVPGMVYDEELKLLRIENLATASKGQLQAVLNLSQPIIIRTPGGGSDRILYPNGDNAANRFDPLLWFSVINGYEPSPSSLLATGSTLFMGGISPIRDIINGVAFPWENRGLINALDTDVDATSEWLRSSRSRLWMKQLIQIKEDGSGSNPNQRWPLYENISDVSDFIVRLNQATVPGNEMRAIAAGEGIFAAVSSRGLFSYSRSDFLVADQGRIAAFDPGGNSTFELTTTGNAGDTEGGNSGAGRPVVNPTRAYPLPNNEILVADPGANRVFRVNRGGTETRAISKFRLDPGRAPANYPANGSLNLNAPRDVNTYTTIKAQADVQAVLTSGGAAYEYWTHYLIADTGNRRLVEVVDRYQYDPVNRRIGDAVTLNGVPQLGVLLWHSPSAVAGKGFEYNSVNRVWVNDRYVYFAGIGGALPTVTDTGTRPPTGTAVRETAGFGGIAVFDASLPNGVTVINRLAIPSFGQNVFWNDATNAFDSVARPATERPLINVNSVTARPVMSSFDGTYQVAVMVTDASGVYEFAYGAPPAASEFIPTVQWMMPNEVYRAMRRGPGGILATSPHDLRAVYARRLESGEVLIVNGYFGQIRGTRNANGTFSNRQPFRGEVVQVDGRLSPALWTATNMNFGNTSITFRLETNSKDTRGLVLPVFADRR